MFGAEPIVKQFLKRPGNEFTVYIEIFLNDLYKVHWVHGQMKTA